MELNQIVDFIKNASEEDISVIKGEIKAKNVKYRPDVLQVCTDDVGKLLLTLPHVTTKHNGYRYDVTAACYVRYVKELTNMILHNYALKPDQRGYPVWSHANTCPEPKVDSYKAVFHTIATTILCLMDSYNTQYNTEKSP